MIRSLAHVALQVTDLEGSLRHASEVLGMRVVERVGGRAYLTLGSQHNTYGGAHHVIEYFEGPVTALEHVAFRAASADGLEQLCHRPIFRRLSTAVSLWPRSRIATRSVSPSTWL